MNAALGKKVALIIFFVLFTIGVVLILGMPRFIARWRRLSRRPGSWIHRVSHEQDPDVLHLPPARAEEPEGDGGNADWISQRREP